MPTTQYDADPFPTSDPLCVAELTGEQLAWRITLHVLAVTGRFVHIPAGVAVDTTTIRVAAGWAYQAVVRASDGGMTVSCERTGRQPEGCGGRWTAGGHGEYRMPAQDPYMHALTVTTPNESESGDRHPEPGGTPPASHPPENQA